MPTLHVVTKDTRAVLKWGIISAISLYILWNGFFFIKDIFFPPKVPPPTVSFGKLPPVTFPKNFTDEKLTYTLNTKTGDLPAFPDRVNVYPISNPQPNLLNLQDTENAVASVGFVNQDGTQLQGRPLTDTLYDWTNPLDLPRTIKIDIVTRNFNLTSPYATYSGVLNGISTIKPEDLPGNALSILTQLNPAINDIDDNKTQTKNLSIENGIAVPAKGGYDTLIQRVDFFQKDLVYLAGAKDTAPIYYDNYPNSAMNVLLAGQLDNSDADKQVVEANSFYQSIDRTTSATYPIITAQQAFDELKAGKGYIAGFYGTNTHVSITDVTIGYYLGNQIQQYAWPIIVFSNSDDGFYAYVSAIPNTWIEE